MKLRTLIDNVHGRYEVQVETFGFTANETEQIANFGEPLVEVGGAFSGSVTRPDNTTLTVTFTLPTATRRLRTDVPFKQIFDLEDDPDSDAKAKVWADTVVARCTAAKATLMVRTSPFEGETVITT